MQSEVRLVLAEAEGNEVEDFKAHHRKSIRLQVPRDPLADGVGPSRLITAPIHQPILYLRPIGGSTSPASSESAASCACASVLAVYTRSVTDGSA